VFRIHHSHHPVLHVLVTVVVLTLVVLAVLAVARWWSDRRPAGAVASGPPVPPADPALVELRIRFARGELSSDEYWYRVATLGYQVPVGMVPGGPAPSGPTG